MDVVDVDVDGLRLRRRRRRRCPGTRWALTRSLLINSNASDRFTIGYDVDVVISLLPSIHHGTSYHHPFDTLLSSLLLVHP